MNPLEPQGPSGSPSPPNPAGPAGSPPTEEKTTVLGKRAISESEEPLKRPRLGNPEEEPTQSSSTDVLGKRKAGDSSQPLKTSRTDKTQKSPASNNVAKLLDSLNTTIKICYYVDDTDQGARKNLKGFLKDGERDKKLVFNINHPHAFNRASTLNILLNKDGNKFDLLPIAAGGCYDGIVRFLLAQGADIGMTTKNGYTPLHIAAQNNHLKMVEFLLDKGANIEAADKNEATPLHFAANKGHLGMVELLFKRGADIEAADKNGATPLHFAALHGFVEMARFLLDKNAEIDVTAKSGATPLHFAATNNQLAMVEFLFDKGADVKATDKNGYTPLGFALRHGHANIAELLLNETRDLLAPRAHHLMHAYIRAARTQKTDMLTTITNRIDINTRFTSRQITLLHKSVSIKNINLVKTLIEEFNAYVNAPAASGLTPIQGAIEQLGTENLENDKVKLREIIKYLLEHKDIKLDTYNTAPKYTPLRKAAKLEDRECVEMLVEKIVELYGEAWLKTEIEKIKTDEPDLAEFIQGVILNKTFPNNSPTVKPTNEDGYTPLHQAAEEGNLKDIERLLDEGADVEALNNDKFTPLVLAIINHHDEAVELLAKITQDKAAPNLLALLRAMLETIANPALKMLSIISRSFPIDARHTAEETTVLRFAVEERNKDMVRHLLEKFDAYVNASDIYGVTPLHFAIQSLHDEEEDGEKDKLREIVELLLEHAEINPNTFSSDGITPLHEAAKGEDPECVQMLIGKLIELHDRSWVLREAERIEALEPRAAAFIQQAIPQTKRAIV